jgi:type IV pilus assembly protein PilB
MGFLEEEDLIKTAAKVFKKKTVNLDKENIDSDLVKMVPYNTARKYGVFPINKKGDSLVLAMSDVQDIMALDDISMLIKNKVEPVLCTRAQISEYIEKFYKTKDSLYDLLKNMDKDINIKFVNENKEIVSHSGQGEEESEPVIKLVNIIFGDAVESRASDIHIEPGQEDTQVRYRIDGVLKDIMKVPNELYAYLAVRVKVLANLDIIETKKSQDGRVSIELPDRNIDLRISVIPAFHGEKIVIRLLDRTSAVVSIDRVGFEKEERDIFTRAVSSPQGMVLVTGPTGSGKTSTLYAALNFVNNETKNIVTIEDPVEYVLEGINQIQVNPFKNVTFSQGLRNILRQDPDVVMVGEIRDSQTAEIAFRSSLTGHLVLTTLHTNDSVSTVTRLLDMNLEPYLIASSIKLVVAQRLVRLICPECKKQTKPDEKLKEQFKSLLQDLNINTFYKGTGCKKCAFSGYFGRTAIFEILRFNEKIRGLVSQKASQDIIFKEACNSGMKTLEESGLMKVKAEITSLEEVGRVIQDTGSDTVLAQPPPTEGDVQADSRTKKEKILVVDDEEDIRKILRMRLTRAGYEVLTAGDGQEGVNIAEKERPDLIVMDIMMPELNGIEAVKILRSRLETAVIPVVMLTAKQDKQSELKGLDAGADDYITKPFDKDVLIARINMLLKKKERFRQ